MTVTVGGNIATVSFGTLTIENVPIGTEVPIQFTASEELLGSQFGLTDPTDQIRAVVTGEERGPDGETVLASGQGTEVEFQFDIGASFGLNVSARALTVSDEDVAALLGSLDASVGDGAKLLTTITLDSQDLTLGRMTKTGDAYDPVTFTAIDPVTGYMVTVDGVDHTVPVTRVSNDDGTLTFTLKADSDEIAAAYLEGIAVLPTTEHFKGTVTANVLFDATREITSDEGDLVILLASAEKGHRRSGLIQYLTASGLRCTRCWSDRDRDHSISLASLFLNSDTPIASYPDGRDPVLRGLQHTVHGPVSDGSSRQADRDALQSAIADAPIGRVVGDTIQLTVAQAQNAHLVVSADAHLDPSTINLAAFTREPSTGDEYSQRLRGRRDWPRLRAHFPRRRRPADTWLGQRREQRGRVLPVRPSYRIRPRCRSRRPCRSRISTVRNRFGSGSPRTLMRLGGSRIADANLCERVFFDTGSLAGTRYGTDGDARRRI